MSNIVGKLGALAAGALAMYYLDPQSGAQRRAALVDLVASGVPGTRRSEERLRRRAPRRTYHLEVKSDPQSDAELRDRIQQRLGTLVSHPGALQVAVEDGVVRLSGGVLAAERDGLLLQVQAMPGVQKLVNAMTAHDTPEGFAGEGTPGSPSPVAA